MSRVPTFMKRGCFVALVIATAGGVVTATAPNARANERYTVPDGPDVEVLANFLSDLLAYSPSTQEEAQEYQQNAPEAMTLAAQKIMEMDQDPQSEHRKLAQKYLLALDVMSIDKATADEKQNLLNIIQQNLAGPNMDADDLDIAVAFAEGLEMIGDAQLAAATYESFATILQSNSDPLITELGQLMEGSARRLKLMGNQVSITGTTLDGRSFDWNAYRGKVVLVDFWATWCGPCIQEMGNLRKLYDNYNAQGFEVVGICMDEERERLDKFVEATPMPWVTLAEPAGQTNPTAVHYGITALPTTFLVDRDGRVVSFNARGAELEKFLQQMLGNAN